MIQEIQVQELEVKSVAIAEVLAAQGVFGREEGEWLEMEKRDFINSVTRHAQEDASSAWGYLELTYRSSSVRLIIKTKIQDGAASYRSIDAYDHPFNNPKMDYDELNRAIQSVFV